MTLVLPGGDDHPPPREQRRGAPRGPRRVGHHARRHRGDAGEPGAGRPTSGSRRPRTPPATCCRSSSPTSRTWSRTAATAPNTSAARRDADRVRPHGIGTQPRADTTGNRLSGGTGRAPALGSAMRRASSSGTSTRASARTLRLFGQFESLCGKSASHMILSTPIRSRFRIAYRSEIMHTQTCCGEHLRRRRGVLEALVAAPLPRVVEALEHVRHPARRRPPTARPRQLGRPLKTPLKIRSPSALIELMPHSAMPTDGVVSGDGRMQPRRRADVHRQRQAGLVARLEHGAPVAGRERRQPERVGVLDEEHRARSLGRATLDLDDGGRARPTAG